MTDLDKRLQEILNHYRNGLTSNQHRIPHTEAIAAIHHAFKDAGWMPWDGSPMKIEPSAKYEANMMTGAEWYERFISEVEKPRPFDITASEYTMRMLEAARHASGINNDKAKQ